VLQSGWVILVRQVRRGVVDEVWRDAFRQVSYGTDGYYMVRFGRSGLVRLGWERCLRCGRAWYGRFGEVRVDQVR
jgi:hypothetical protein